MTAEKKRWRRAAIFAAIVLLAAALIAPVIPANERDSTRTTICTRCGIRRFEHQTRTTDIPEQVLENFEEMQATELSKWHDAHYPELCSHVWRSNHFTSFGYLHLGPLRFRAGSGEAGSSVTPKLVHLNAESRADLDALFERSPTECQEYIESGLKPRS